MPMKSIVLRQISMVPAATALLCAPALAAALQMPVQAPVPTQHLRPFLTVTEPASQAALWQRIVRYLPEVFRRGPGIQVLERTQEQITAAATALGAAASDGDGPVDGLYLPPPNAQNTPAEVMVRRSLRGELAGLVFTHELGHYVWQTELTMTQREAYRAIWKAQVKRGSLITTYANVSAQEGFAESFAWYIRKPVALRRTDAESYAFLSGLAHRRQPQPASQRTRAPKGADLSGSIKIALPSLSAASSTPLDSIPRITRG